MMAQQVYIFHKTDRVAVEFVDPPNGAVKKIISIEAHVFLSTTSHFVYHGEVHTSGDEGHRVTLRRIDFTAADIASDSKNLFIIDESGHVLKIVPGSLEVVETIILRDEVKLCSHGCKQENETLKLRSLSTSPTSALFTTDSGHLWASGSHPQLSISTANPKPVIFFDGRTISSTSSGSNFHVVIARKTPKTPKDDTDSENDPDEVFVSSCPQCLSTIRPSPQSLTSSDTCPMALHPHQYSSDPSLTSLTPQTHSPTPAHPDRGPKLVNGHRQSDACKDESKKNVIFINTEAARQFLTRQLSWVSSYGNVKEETELTTNPTGLIKQNVSNMANLVYEGVKTMGDKVATLSRHVSGSSEINDIRDDITADFEDLLEDNKPSATSLSLAQSLRCEEFPWSSSTGSLEHELSQQGLNERINSLVDIGTNLLSTELWTWGDVSFGQLGTGDIIKRPKPVLVNKLHNTGVKKVSSGLYHTLSLTLDGRVFGWGRNDHFQVHADSATDQSSPKLMSPFANSRRARDISTGDRHSLIVFDDDLFFIGSPSGTGLPAENEKTKVTRLDTQNSIKYISSSGSYSLCSTSPSSPPGVTEDLKIEQIFLEEMITVHQNFIKPFQKKAGATQESNVYDTLCRCYSELLSLTALNVSTLEDYSNQIGEAYEVSLVSHYEEFIAVYKYYLNAICDAVSLGGFGHMGKMMSDLPAVVTKLFNDSSSTPDHQTPRRTQEVIAVALQYPLTRLNRYKHMIQTLIKTNGSKMGIERLQEALIKWERIIDDQERRVKEAEMTRVFWESSGKLVDLLRAPERRLIRESRSHPIFLFNSSRFTSHWFILLTDIFIHASGASHTVHALQTLWVEPLADSEGLQNALSIVTPEESFVLYTSGASERNEWLQGFQSAIRNSLPRVVGSTPPRDRSCTYLFLKHPVFKDAKYVGRWSNGKVHGFGKMEWADGRLYTGQFYKGVIQGHGRMEVPTQGIYEGMWRDGVQNGCGVFRYINGDVYEGIFKDGVPHGHGSKREGHFMASVATVYIGEWAAGVKSGYGVMDDIMTGEKYLGSWSGDMKHGCGLIVTLDGIYYEGVFVQDVLTGHGVMVFEDGTHYEGEFKSAGTFCGKGTLTFRSGDRLEGTINGAWNEPVKVTATLHISKASSHPDPSPKPPSFGKLCVPPEQKWKAIFRHCYQQLGLPDLHPPTPPNSKETPQKRESTPEKKNETQKLWQNVAVIINKSHQKSMSNRTHLNFPPSKVDRDKDRATTEKLMKIPELGDKLTREIYGEVHDYLMNAFESRHHPLGCLLSELSGVYTATYGGVRVHPLLLSHAVAELRSITMRIYEIVVLFFPALPKGGEECILEGQGEEESKVISAAAILHPILLPRVHSALFVLYALHNKREDDAYWERLVKWNKQPDQTLMGFLDIDQKFWGRIREVRADGMEGKDGGFGEAVETLQQLKTTFSPLEKLLVIRSTFEQMTKTVQKQLGTTYLWTMDELFPVFNFVVVRASVLQLGSEIHFIEDFMEPHLVNGELDIMFTTLKACYYQILQEKMSMTD
ncbi:alsin [Diachasma alloeum]|uniref:alsin n=1 Tax=Diachasma alloeum TaxID=454923 RepID=UPI0007382D44|nr:alsin [Diachasma alloeum]